MTIGELLKKFDDVAEDVKIMEIENKRLKDESKQPLYAFLYNPMIHESGYITVSIHRTRKGAEKALEWHRKQCIEDWNEFKDTFGKSEYSETKNKDWKIETIEILD